MPSSFNFEPKGVQRFSQISESHCGPAVTQMLLSNLGIIVSQEEIAEAAGVADTIEDHGTRVDQIAQAVRVLAPSAQMWVKEEAELEDLLTLVNQYGYPTAVEWQGEFGQNEDDEEFEEGDYGHYSIITNIDVDFDTVTIIDPYRDYVLRDRFFSLGEFLSRWWDVNDVFDDMGRSSEEEDYHLLFIITPKGASFPKLLGLRPL